MLDGEARVSPELVKRMADTIVHRGPDDEGYYVAGPVGLGFRRLSIIDLKSGHQPLSNEDDTIWIVFNGEIYNYQELRELLLSKGHVFKTRTDTEVIVHLYEEFGPKCLEKMRGMFAFAIWDSNNKALFLARDRVGIKPLYYGKAGDRSRAHRQVPDFPVHAWRRDAFVRHSKTCAGPFPADQGRKANRPAVLGS